MFSGLRKGWLIVLFFPLFANAQMYSGLMAGYTSTTFSGLYQLDQYKSPSNGVMGGLNNSFQIYKNFYADLAFGYIEKGSQYNFPQFNDSIIGSLEGEWTFSYFHFPLTFNYKIPFSKNFRFCPGIGMYADMFNNWQHYQKINNRGFIFESTEKGGFEKNGRFNRWDVGIQFQGSFEIDLGKDYIFFGARYSDSWTDILYKAPPGNFQPRNQGTLFFIGFMYNWEVRYF